MWLCPPWYCLFVRSCGVPVRAQVGGSAGGDSATHRTSWYSSYVVRERVYGAHVCRRDRVSGAKL